MCYYPQLIYYQPRACRAGGLLTKVTWCRCHCSLLANKWFYTPPACLPPPLLQTSARRCYRHTFITLQYTFNLHFVFHFSKLLSRLTLLRSISRITFSLKLNTTLPEKIEHIFICKQRCKKLLLNHFICNKLIRNTNLMLVENHHQLHHTFLSYIFIRAKFYHKWIFGNNFLRRMIF